MIKPVFGVQQLKSKGFSNFDKCLHLFLPTGCGEKIF